LSRTGSIIPVKQLEIDTPVGPARAHLERVDDPRGALVLGHGAGGGVTALDTAWKAVIENLVADDLRGLPLVVGGRSSGARVACRTAESTGAAGVLCLAFPLRPPRRSGSASAPSRLPELDAVTVPMLVVQGTGDRFGMPPSTERRLVVQVPGDHSLRGDLGAATETVRAWLLRVVD